MPPRMTIRERLEQLVDLIGDSVEFVLVVLSDRVKQIGPGARFGRYFHHATDHSPFVAKPVRFHQEGIRKGQTVEDVVSHLVEEDFVMHVPGRITGNLQ